MGATGQPWDTQGGTRQNSCWLLPQEAAIKGVHHILLAERDSMTGGVLCRARLSDLDNWKVQVEAASQHFDGVLGGLRGNWYRLEQRFDQIANRLDHKRTPRAIDSSPYQQQVQQVDCALPCHSLQGPLGGMA